MDDANSPADRVRAPLTPSAEALVAAEAVARRVSNRKAQVRRLFVETSDPAQPSPLARVIRGGRGGQVRLKLLLSILWFAAAPPYDVTYPARAWAALLGLPDPEGRGARRVSEAFSWLESNRFIAVEVRPGHPSRITLLREVGDGSAYSVPGADYNKLRGGVSEDILAVHRYVQLPATFWVNGWLAVLSTPAVAMLLVLLLEVGGRDESTEVWFSPRMASLKYSLSEDTRLAGVNELRRAGLVTIKRRDTNPDPFAVRRLRNVYRLNPDRFELPASIPVEADE